MTTTAKATKSTKAVGVNIKLPEALHRKVRVKAVSKGQTLEQALTEAATKWVGAK